MAHKKNPFENIVLLNKKNSRSIEYLLKKAPEEDVIDGLKEIRSQLKEEEKKSKKLPRAIARIEKLLFDYPGFQKEILDILVSRIRSAKKMGIISKYEPKGKTDVIVKDDSKVKTEVTSKEELPEKTDVVQKDEIKKEAGDTLKDESDAKTDTPSIDESFGKTAMITKDDIEERIDLLSQGNFDEKTDILSQNDVKEKNEIAFKEPEVKIDDTSLDILQAKTGILSKDEFLTKTVRIDRNEMKPFEEEE